MTCKSRLSIVSALCGQFLDPALETAVTSRVKMKTDIRLQSAMSTALVTVVDQSEFGLTMTCIFLANNLYADLLLVQLCNNTSDWSKNIC